MPDTSIIKFGPYKFDPDSLELFRDRSPVELAPQPAKVLKALIEASPAAVMREDLICAIWNGGQHVDAEHSLNACIRQLRSALGDNATNPVYIHTLPKRGYRFLMAGETTRLEKKAGTFNHRWAAIATVLVLGVAALISWDRSGVNNTTDTVSDLLLRAQAFRERGGEGDLDRSLALYEETLALSPELPKALAGKAYVIYSLSKESRGLNREAQAELAMLFAEQAESRGPTVDAALVLGHVSLYPRKDFATAVDYFRLAVERAPDNPSTFNGLAQALAVTGDVEGAALSAKEAMNLDPLKLSSRSDLCWYRLFEKQYEQALEMCAWALEIDPAHNWTLLGLAEAHRHLGEPEKAKEFFLGYLTSEGLATPAAQSQKDIYCSGANSLLEKDPDENSNYYNVAAWFTVCGDLNKASEMLAQARENDEQWLLYFNVDSRFEGYREALGAILANPQ